jgi:rhodanese-related sulfurtransferase
VVQILRENGYKHAYALRGGFDAWIAAEYPVEKKSRAA